MNKILLGFLIIATISCSNQKTGKDLDKPYINSYYELDNKCVELFREILKPYELENDSIRIDKVFRLDLNLDTTLYSAEELTYNYFIGVKLKPDLFHLILFDIDLKYGGAITTCQVYQDNNLIINNYEYLFTNLTELKKCKELNIPDSLFSWTNNSKTMFRQLAWTNKMYGKWQVEAINDTGFINTQFDNIWIFKPEKGFLLENSKNDTLLVDSIDLQGNDLKLIQSGYTFEIATQTKKKILIKEKTSDFYRFLIRKE
jgi:hypothetical protein